MIVAPQSDPGSASARAPLALAPHILMLVGRESAETRRVAERLRHETGVIVDVVQADLEDAVDLTLIDSRLRRDGRIGVIVNNSGITFMVAFPNQGSPHAL